MPKISKGETSSSGVLSRIKKVKDLVPGGIKMSIYGRSKTGKTRLGASFPKPVLIMGSEDGTQSIRATDKVDFVKIQHSSECRVVIENAVSLGYKTFFVDTASTLHDIILAEILGVEKIPPQNYWGMATRDQYAQAAMKIKTILREAIALPMNVLIAAHERNFNEDTEGSEILTPVVGSSLTPSVCRWLNGAVDYICQTFIRAEMRENRTEVPGEEEVHISYETTGKAEYCLRIGPHPIYTTGFRLPEGYTLPDVIVNPTYEKVAGVINGKYRG